MAKGVKTGGRTKGTPNKTTAAVKEALTVAYEGIGGVEQLMAWARENQTEFYKLWSKLLPTEVNLDADVRATIQRIELVPVEPDNS